MIRAEAAELAIEGSWVRDEEVFPPAVEEAAGSSVAEGESEVVADEMGNRRGGRLRRCDERGRRMNLRVD